MKKKTETLLLIITILTQSFFFSNVHTKSGGLKSLFGPSKKNKNNSSQKELAAKELATKDLATKDLAANDLTQETPTPATTQPNNNTNSLPLHSLLTTPLTRKSLAIFKELLQGGASVQSRDSNSNTPLNIAIDALIPFLKKQGYYSERQTKEYYMNTMASEYLTEVEKIKHQIELLKESINLIVSQEVSKESPKNIIDIEKILYIEEAKETFLSEDYTFKDFKESLNDSLLLNQTNIAESFKKKNPTKITRPRHLLDYSKESAEQHLEI